MVRSLNLSEKSKKEKEYLLQLKSDFSELFEEKNNMLINEETFLSALYIEKIGSLKYREYRLYIELQLLKRRMQLLQAYINRNETPILSEIDRKINEEFEAAKKKIVEQEEQIKQTKELLSSNFLTENEAQELKRLYRFIVKRLHPDICPNLSELEKDLFIQAQIAYELSDISKLKKIVLGLESNYVLEEKSSFSMKEQCEILKQKILQLKEDICNLKKIFPFNQRDYLYDKKKIEVDRKQILKNCKDLEKEIEKHKKYVNLLEEWEIK